MEKTSAGKRKRTSNVRTNRNRSTCIRLSLLGFLRKVVEGASESYDEDRISVKKDFMKVMAGSELTQAHSLSSFSLPSPYLCEDLYSFNVSMTQRMRERHLNGKHKNQEGRHFLAGPCSYARLEGTETCFLLDSKVTIINHKFTDMSVMLP